MPTKYESKVNSLKESILKALERHSDPSISALEFLEVAAPSSVPGESSDVVLNKPPKATQGTLLSNAAQATVLHLARQAADQGLMIMELCLGPGDKSAMAHFLDAVLWLAVQSPPALDQGVPASCVETLVEIVTNEECDGVFAYLDSRLGEFQRVMQRSHHALLRTCTVLLKRLSKSQESALRGRVLMFLAKFLPLTERSGVNLLGAFHFDNVTPVENVDEGAVDAEGEPVDVSFYNTFWGLQKWFADPPSVIPAGKWIYFSRDVRAVIDRFAAVKVTVSEAPLGSGGLEGGALPAGGASVKYLSSARLLPLQLRDATFRRHFLIQCLVLIGWVEKPLLKDWASQAAKGGVLEDLESLRDRVYQALEATPERGPEFTAAIKSLMAEEDAWAVWKQAGCPPEPLTVAPRVPPPGIADIEVPSPRKRRRRSQDAVYGVELGTAELDRLWNLTEDNLSSLGADDRGGFRTLRQLMEPVIEEMNEGLPEEDDAFKASKNAIYCWKSLRMVARDSLPAFAASVRRGGDLTVAARALYPDEVPPEPEEVINKPESEVPAPSAEDNDHAAVCIKDVKTGGDRNNNAVGRDAGAPLDAAEAMEEDAGTDENTGVDDEGQIKKDTCRGGQSNEMNGGSENGDRDEGRSGEDDHEGAADKSGHGDSTRQENPEKAEDAEEIEAIDDENKEDREREGGTGGDEEQQEGSLVPM